MTGPYWQGEPTFDGETFEPPRDHDRLSAQLDRVKSATASGAWHTLAQLSHMTGDPEASISARLRDLRKVKFGTFRVERRYWQDGLWTYRVLPPLPPEPTQTSMDLVPEQADPITASKARSLDNPWGAGEAVEASRG